MRFTPASMVLAISAVSAAAMFYVGLYQVRLVDHLKCPILGHGCEAVADAPFARPFGVPDGFLGAALYLLLIGLVVFDSGAVWIKYSTRGVAVLAGVANVLGVLDMSRFGAYCFYCLLTTVLVPVLLWMAFRLS